MRHAKLSPSASARWLACPGSAEANWGRPHTSNAYSLLGTSAHTLLEVCMRTGHDPEAFYGKLLKKGHNTVDQDMVDGVGYALDWVNAYLANNPSATLHIEEEVNYEDAIGAPKDWGFGFPDIQIDNYPVELVTLDYKHGEGISVEVDANTQLRLYHAGKRQARGRYRRYRSVIVQPRLRGRKPIQEATYTDAQLAKWLAGTVAPTVITIVEQGREAPRNAGKHCRYCVADGNCKAQFARVQQAAKEDFMKDPKALTPAEMAKCLDTLEFIDAFAKALRERAITDAHAGVNIPGYEAGFNPTRRMWSDEEEANTKLQALGLPRADRYEVKLISPATAEDVLKKAGKWPKKQRGVKIEFTPLDDVVTRTEASKTIKRVPKAQ